jgi:hypothetical protein
MSALALEVDQAMQRLDAITASRLERLVRDTLALVQPISVADSTDPQSIRFPLVQGSRLITSEEVARLQDEA